MYVSLPLGYTAVAKGYVAIPAGWAETHWKPEKLKHPVRELGGRGGRHTGLEPM